MFASFSSQKWMLPPQPDSAGCIYNFPMLGCQNKEPKINYILSEKVFPISKSTRAFSGCCFPREFYFLQRISSPKISEHNFLRSQLLTIFYSILHTFWNLKLDKEVPGMEQSFVTHITFWYAKQVLLTSFFYHLLVGDSCLKAFDGWWLPVLKKKFWELFEYSKRNLSVGEGKGGREMKRSKDPSDLFGVCVWLS